MEGIDFISIRGQQSFEDKAKINPIELKIEDYKIQNLLGKCRKNSVIFKLEGLLFTSQLNSEYAFQYRVVPILSR